MKTKVLILVLIASISFSSYYAYSCWEKKKNPMTKNIIGVYDNDCVGLTADIVQLEYNGYIGRPIVIATRHMDDLTSNGWRGVSFNNPISQERWKYHTKHKIAVFAIIYYVNGVECETQSVYPWHFKESKYPYKGEYSALYTVPEECCMLGDTH